MDSELSTDIETMRATAERACALGGAPSGDLDELIVTLCGDVEVLAPEVRQLAALTGADTRASMAAFVGVEESQRRIRALRMVGGDRERAARKTAMAVLALCTHFENLVQPSVC